MKWFARFILTVSTVFLASAGPAPALSKAPPRPLADRVAEAEKLFVGTLVDLTEEGDWVRAELRVDEPLRGVGAKQKIQVIWRRKLGDFTVYDAKEGTRGIAILKDRHEGRYWLRSDTFEPVGKLAEVKRLPGVGKEEIPTFEEWVKAGKPLPEGMMFTGGTPWFNESSGTKRSAEEVYEILYGKAAKGTGPAASGGRFPAHWGDPPKIQTRDLRPLPGGYGRGSSTLANWIKMNMEKDARSAAGDDESD